VEPEPRECSAHGSAVAIAARATNLVELLLVFPHDLCAPFDLLAKCLDFALDLVGQGESLRNALAGLSLVCPPECFELSLELMSPHSKFLGLGRVLLGHGGIVGDRSTGPSLADSKPSRSSSSPTCRIGFAVDLHVVEFRFMASS
jgi:hypothetical protein